MSNRNNPPFVFDDDFLGINPVYLRLTIAALFIVLTQLYWISQNLYVEDGIVPVAQTDAPIYFQYARAWAQGHPFRFFTAADHPTTGCTSTLYPFLLSALYLLPVKGSGVILAGFWLQVALLATTIFIIGKIAREIHHSLQYPTMLLVTLSGQTWYSFLSQTDMGFFVFLAMSSLFCMLTNKRILGPLLLLLLSATHPLGFVFAVLLFCIGILYIRRYPLFVISGICGIGGYILIFFLNYKLTGHTSFMSLNHKGYFQIVEIVPAIYLTMTDTISIIREVFFGLGSNQRPFNVFPVVAGLLALVGISLYPWHVSRKALSQLWILLTAVATILLIGSSHWQGISNDRYMAFIIPVWIIYMLYGLYATAHKTKHRQSYVARSGFLILLGFQCISTIGYWNRFHMDIGNHVSDAHFAHEQLNTLPENTSIGVLSGCGAALYGPPREMHHIVGIMSAEFAWQPELLYCVENFKYNSQNRVDTWMCSESKTRTVPWLETFMGETIAADRRAPHSGSTPFLKQADWSLLPYGTGPDKTITTNELTFHPVDRLEMGYLKDENKMNYDSDTYWIGTKPLSFMAVLTNHQNIAYADVGHAIIGSCSFTPTVNPRQDLMIVLRTSIHANFPANNGYDQDYNFVNPLPLEVNVDDFETINYELTLATNGMTDATFIIPGDYIQSANPRITLTGDFVAYALWFYQTR